MPDTELLDHNNIPRHIAIIMDGNGRWAKDRGLPRVMGHKVGVESVQNIVRAANDLGVQVLTLYAFSTENWKRPAFEVQALMMLLKTYLEIELVALIQNNVRLQGIGDITQMPSDVQAILNKSINASANNTGLVLNLALNYGGRHEIVNAAKNLASQCVNGSLTIDEINENLFSRALYTGGLPDPDLLIRTGGESRLSNFLLWQLSYAEIFITETRWPDFRKDQLIEAIRDYQQRQRRFGKTGEQIEQGQANGR